jgi:hypothetical protein
VRLKGTSEARRDSSGGLVIGARPDLPSAAYRDLARLSIPSGCTRCAFRTGESERRARRDSSKRTAELGVQNRRPDLPARSVPCLELSGKRSAPVATVVDNRAEHPDARCRIRAVEGYCSGTPANIGWDQWEGGSRPRAADDFVAIRARLEELRRERDQVRRQKAREEYLNELHQAALDRALGATDQPEPFRGRR